jgi:chemotaxis signal transduction protein
MSIEKKDVVVADSAKGNEPVGRNPDAPETEEQGAGDEESLFVFRLASSLYAFPATSVNFIVPEEVPVRVPTSPAHLLGIVHVRGRIVTVVDLPSLLRFTEKKPGKGANDQLTRRLMVLSAQNQMFGINPDEELGIFTVKSSDISKTTKDMKTADQSIEVLRGRFELDSAVVTILHPEAVLDALTGTRKQD